MFSQFTIEPYAKAWVYRSCNQMTENEFIQAFIALIEKHNLRVDIIKDLVMIYQNTQAAGDGNKVIDAVVELYPKYAKALFTTRVSVLTVLGAQDRVLAAAAEYEALYGADTDSASARLTALLMKGYEENKEEIGYLMELLEGGN